MTITLVHETVHGQPTRGSTTQTQTDLQTADQHTHRHSQCNNTSLMTKYIRWPPLSRQCEIPWHFPDGSWHSCPC